ncbi:MAG: hypothetical protein KF821_10185 [Anaerolineales bacterium]|jgi:multisubunit Na+/H+ antiporter MnhF subunit|nr:hypothetical protein [Anaerolineales bacterium]MBX3006177.1 hypothetical protein [Anaerolineales bacterium]MCW5838968.1 hypothetical protein [Anaerolineales bacterium]MCW5888768.1 hypothetical protein [Anaerolineales bacterium]
MNWFDIGIEVLLVILTLSFVLGFMRLIKGPDVPNRALAFDLIALQAVGMVALIAIRHEAPMLLDIVMVAAVLGFLGTVLLARYLEDARDGE